MPRPIAIISFNRPLLLEQVVRSLRDQSLPPDPENVFLFQDGGPEAIADECLKVFSDAFPRGRAFVAEDNLGTAMNIDRAERFMFETLETEAGIFFEDDLRLGPAYLTVLNRLIDLALADERIGYVAAFGNYRATREQQIKDATKLRPLHLLWGFGLTRRHWLKCRPYVEQYLQLVRGFDYRRRDEAAIRLLCASWGIEPGDTAQDRIKSFVTGLVGAIKLNTETAYGRYVGEIGQSFSPATFRQWGFEDAPYFTEPQSLDFDLSSISFDPWSSGHNVSRLSEPVTDAQVVSIAYRLILGREAESEAVVRSYVGMPLPRLGRIFLTSSEFKAKNSELLSPDDPSRSIAKLVTACQSGPPKIIIGSGPTRYKGWHETDVPWLDLRKPEQWEFYFSRHGLRAALMEHVLEHLTEQDAEAGLRNVLRFLLPGGHIRIAVPDGNFRDPDYIEWVRPGGNGPGAKDHKMLWTIESLTQMLHRVGFDVQPIEYFQPDGTFVGHPWSDDDGHISRSRHNDKRNTPTTVKYTSLIVDGVRP